MSLTQLTDLMVGQMSQEETFRVACQPLECLREIGLTLETDDAFMGDLRCAVHRRCVELYGAWLMASRAAA